MTGLLFFGVIGLWGMISLYLGIKLPKCFKLRSGWSFLFAPLLLFAPVIDEVIAIPRAYVLCKQAEDAFWYDSSVKGGVLKYYDEYSSEETTVGLNIRARIERATSVIQTSQRPAIRRMKVYFSEGFLKIPAGSSGTFMALLLPEQCPSKLWSIHKYQDTVRSLKLTL
ncbi:hypothetical protein [Herbaspirillum frisingense]|uniref:hypothetical protein n=1 Tax=Herbaspirillum frisingense TaxID=92645 RepID=UPI001F1D6511|nr:hypothetical protein [Herbaspirillum frisingense]UIN22212.1 hypothetical protein LAZ82_03620 [Herbaspirillum frisingense]